MRFNSFHKLLMIAPLSVALGWAQQPSSLAEIAKQGKSSKKAKIVVGDDDVLHSTASPSESNAALEDTETTKPADAAPDTKAKGGTAQQSRDPQVNELRQRIDKLKTAEAGYKDGLKAGQERLSKASSDFERQTAQEIIANQSHNVQVTSDKRKEAEGQLQALEANKNK